MLSVFQAFVPVHECCNTHSYMPFLAMYAHTGQQEMMHHVRHSNI